MRFKLIIAYDGTRFAGWQVQKNGSAIQPLIQKALETVLRHPLDLTGSGRTDAGVHARGQTAHFDTEVSVDPKRLALSLNALLPPDIRILEIEPVASDFHARYSARSKIYHYHLSLEPDPFTLLYRHPVYGSFDLELLKAGAKEFIGTHDFTSFVNTGQDKSAVRTIYRIDIVEQKGGIRLEFEGNGFLYKMVRNITGALLDIAAGKLKPEDIKTILAARDRRRASASAPAKGLFLFQVNY
ncbi:MAG: tRNA pseudouridine(38-40) synthase TruA [Parachlamydiales bacterium]|nr:tRNA pseudouridine(38-40) synthase TruA [Parachlamydiales bacterium]